MHVKGQLGQVKNKNPKLMVIGKDEIFFLWIFFN
jgi:hypothetical protein